MNFWEKAEKFPPFIVRALARHRRGPALTTEEISKRSGLQVQYVAVVSQMTNWGGIDLLSMRRFLIGCGIDFENYSQMKRVTVYLNDKPKWKHLKKTPEWETLWVPLLRKMMTGER